MLVLQTIDVNAYLPTCVFNNYPVMPSDRFYV